ncbi:MAG: nitroreductase [Sedimentisphaerales bacterium]|nr:nitroreductase [Sedimentisphaerales bacterium]
MNKVIETIMSRRSVRFYDTKPIPKEILQTIIDAGNAAPSGMNTQGWRFVVVQGKAFKDKLLSLAMPRYKKWMEKAPQSLSDMRKEIDAAANDPVYYNAPVIIFVIGSGMTSDFDTPMVCQNMMLAARSLDIGSCWVYFGQLPLDDMEVRKELEIQPDEKVYGPILLGYPKGEFPKSPKKKEPKIKWI